MSRVVLNDSLTWIGISFEQKVEVEEEMNNYNLFNLIVEVGSSLGLWIGLSAIGVFDTTTQLIFHTFEDFSRKQYLVRVKSMRS